MNPNIPPATSALKLAPRTPHAPGGGAATDSGTPFDADLEALREREANLRAYEQRLRAWQAELDSRPAARGSAGPFRPSSRIPFTGDTELEAAWGKLHRSHALMEAEQNQLRDDRMTVREMEKQLKQREAELAAREARVTERERLLAEKTPAAPAHRKASAVERFTTAPFRAARAVFKTGP